MNPNEDAAALGIAQAFLAGQQTTRDAINGLMAFTLDNISYRTGETTEEPDLRNYVRPNETGLHNNEPAT